MSDDVSLKIHLNNIENNTNRDVVDLNARILENFLAYGREEALKVIIVEGQYNPLGYTDKTLDLNKVVHHHFLNIDYAFESMTFIPRTEVM